MIDVDTLIKKKIWYVGESSSRTDNRVVRLTCFRLYGQVNKRIWWMPWQLKAMKDVAACDKPRGVGKQTLIRGFPNGETRHLCHCVLNS